MFKIIAERPSIILLSILIFMMWGIIYTSRLNTVNGVTSTIMIKSQLSSGLDLLSQAQIIKSFPVIRQLIVDNKLYQNSEFGGSSQFESFEDMAVDQQQEMIAYIQSRFEIHPVAKTSIINLSFQSDDIDVASLIVNALPSAYTKIEETKTKEAAILATEWLSARLDVLRDDVIAAEIELREFQRDNNLMPSEYKVDQRGDIDFLNQKLSELEVDFDETKLILDILRQDGDSKNKFGALGGFLPPELVNNIKSIENKLLQRKELLETRYGSNHPEMIEFQNDFKSFNDKLDQEIEVFEKSLANVAQVQEAQIKKINKKIDDYRLGSQVDVDKRLQIERLQEKIDSARSIFNNFTTTYMQSLQGLSVYQSPIRVISPALKSVEKVKGRFRVVLWAGITGLFLGIFISLVLGKIQNTIQTSQQIENILGLPVYASLPKVKFSKDVSVTNYILKHPTSALAELMRSFNTSMQLRDPHQKSGGRVVTVTSTHTNEGKTTTAIWLATTAAQSGKKVLVVDADMRRPSLHKAYGLGNARGLADYLSDRLPLEDTIYKKHPSGVHIMTSKAIPTHALTLLGSERMEILLRRVRDAYDLIILDCPTSYVFSDARVMAKLSDKTFYIVEWKKTKRDDLKETVKHYIDMNYDNLSFVLNKVADKKLIHFGGDELSYMDKA